MKLAVGILVAVLAFTGCKTSEGDDDYVIVCYFANWARYHHGYSVSHIDPALCTHVVYAFAKFDENGVVSKTDVANDETMYTEVMERKKVKQNLTVSLALGGWTFGVKLWSKVVETEKSTRNFAQNTINYLRTHGFDGLDLDWEFPAMRNSSALDRERFSNITMILREEIDAEAVRTGRTRLELTAAVGASEYALGISYEVAKISGALDKIHLMAYDMLPNNNKSGHHSALNRSDAVGVNNYVDIARMWQEEGADSNKLVFGLGAYGRRQYLANETVWQSGSWVQPVPQNYTNDAAWSFITYREICQLKEGSVHWLEEERVPFMVNGHEWIGFDNVASITEKAEWVKENNFGGVMLWALFQDDFDGTKCGQGKYPLLRAAAEVLLPKGSIPTPAPTVDPCYDGYEKDDTVVRRPNLGYSGCFGPTVIVDKILRRPNLVNSCTKSISSPPGLLALTVVLLVVNSLSL